MDLSFDGNTLGVAVSTSIQIYEYDNSSYMNVTSYLQSEPPSQITSMDLSETIVTFGCAEYDQRGIVYIYEKIAHNNSWERMYSTDQGSQLRPVGNREGQSVFLASKGEPRVLLFSQPEMYFRFNREGVVYSVGFPYYSRHLFVYHISTLINR